MTLEHGAAARALRASDVLAQTTLLIGSVEELAPRTPRPSRYLPWRVARIAYPKWLRGRPGEIVFSDGVNRAVSVVKLSTAATLLVVGSKTRIGRAARVVQLLAHAYEHVRFSGLGRDGSDHALVVHEGAQLWAAFSPSGSASERIAAEFIGVQGILSYASSGLVKIISPVWRSGEAITGVLRTTSYGDARFYKKIKDYPAVARAMAWGVIIGECLGPFVPVLPRPIRAAWQAAMVLMHALIARHMGLNRFMWAFAAFHPSVEFVSERIHRRLFPRREGRKRR